MQAQREGVLQSRMHILVLYTSARIQRRRRPPPALRTQTQAQTAALSEAEGADEDDEMRLRVAQLQADVASTQAAYDERKTSLAAARERESRCAPAGARGALNLCADPGAVCWRDALAGGQHAKARVVAQQARPPAPRTAAPPIQPPRPLPAGPRASKAVDECQAGADAARKEMAKAKEELFAVREQRDEALQRKERAAKALDK